MLLAVVAATPALISRQLPYRAQPILDMIRPHDLPALDRVHIDRHQLERLAAMRHAQELAGRRAGGLAAHRDAIYGPLPATEDEAGLKQFSALMKLEPFQRGMKELAPSVWITALRKVQNPNRAELDIFSLDSNFGSLKVSPVFYLSDAEMEAYLEEHHSIVRNDRDWGMPRA